MRITDETITEWRDIDARRSRGTLGDDSGDHRVRRSRTGEAT
jgi:hypothetical protein